MMRKLTILSKKRIYFRYNMVKQSSKKQYKLSRYNKRRANND